MDASTSNSAYKDRTQWFKIGGILLLLSGIAVGFLAPLEMYCFYLFSEGGRFHYTGFRFGSFMFGNIAAQIAGYYLIAALLIPLGYGHLKLRRWVGPLTQALLWAWLVVGAPLSVLAAFILFASKDLSLPATLMMLVFLGVSYLVAPGLLIRFYRGQNARQTLAAQDTRSYWIEGLPTPILVLSALYAFYIIMLHILILFNGMYPVFGVLRYGLQGIVLLDLTIACLAFITWGTLQQRPWAWWGSVILLGLFTCSTVLTFCRSSYPVLLAGLAFPPRELEILGGVPAQGYHFALLVGIPLVITWAVTLLSRRHFSGRAEHPGCAADGTLRQP
jgi:MFS family permease